jgi:hypothetical protein
MAAAALLASPAARADAPDAGEGAAWTTADSLTLAGAAMFGSAYLPSLIVGLADAASSDDPDSAKLSPLLVPLAGPIIVGFRDDPSPGGGVLLGAAALVQTTGFVLLAVGAALALDPDGPVTATADGVRVRW